ncbi:MAG TPA: CotH kinase family protein, partial [Sedimentisphaerales bacterium]|nr:CotH kinase family protein [Sedimentisphaerales bacterium]
MNRILRLARIILAALATSLLLAGVAGAVCPVGDLSRDCKVDFADIRLYAEQWLNESGCFDPDCIDPNCADLDGADGVNIFDFAILTRNWRRAGHPIMINELMASNSSFEQDPQGDYDDWLELYNGGAEAFDVGGMHLTNDISEPTQWRIPDNVSYLTTLPPHGHLRIWADKDTGDSPGLHADFKIDADGGEVALFDSNGTTPVDSVAFDVQGTNISYGRYPDGGSSWRYFGTPTPAGINDGAYAGLVEDPQFSHKRGFYDRTFTLTIACETEDVLMYYSTKGIEPGVSDGRYYSGTRYTNPFPISETTCLRVRAVKAGWKPSPVKTQTYIFGADDATKSLPIVSLVGDEEETFYEPDGIMAIVGGYYSGGVWTSDGPDSYNNIMQRGMAYERPVSFEYFNTDDGSDLQVDCGIRVHGSEWIRPRYLRCEGDLPYGWTGDCKIALRLYFRSMYGENQLEYPMFPYGLDKSDAIVLRSGHNDRENPFIRDELLRRLHMDMGSAVSTGTHANLFINGQYKGYYNPCEHIKDSFCQEYYNSDEEWDVMTMSGIRDGNRTSWDEMINYARNHDLTSPVHYRELAGRLDIPAFADYLILQLWCANWDWPSNNWAAASERSDEGIWPFFTWDAEGGLT